MNVTVTTEPLPNSQVALNIVASKEECTSAWNKVLKNLSKQANVSGFRKGHVPKQILINMVGRDAIKSEACQELIERSVKKALKDTEICAIGQARFIDKESADRMMGAYEPEKEISFQVKIDVWPIVHFKKHVDDEGIEVEAVEVGVEDGLVDKALNELRKRESFTVVAPEGATAEMGKVVVASMVGWFEEEDGSKGQRLPDVAEGGNLEVNMQEGQYMPGFVEGLVGMKVGDTRTIPVQFPEQLQNPALRGKKAIFDVTLNALKDRVLPELDDGFVKKSTQNDTVEELKRDVRSRLGEETEKATEKNIEKAIEDMLVDLVEVELPETLVENETQSRFATMMTDFKTKGMSNEQVKSMVTKENYEKYKKTASKNVLRRLTINMAISKIANDNNLNATEEEIQGQMDLIKAELKGEEIDEQRARDHVQGQLERAKVMDFLKKSWKINMVPEKKDEKAEKKEDNVAQTAAAAVAQ